MIRHAPYSFVDLLAHRLQETSGVRIDLIRNAYVGYNWEKLPTGEKVPKGEHVKYRYQIAMRGVTSTSEMSVHQAKMTLALMLDLVSSLGHRLLPLSTTVAEPSKRS